MGAEATRLVSASSRVLRDCNPTSDAGTSAITFTPKSPCERPVLAPQSFPIFAETRTKNPAVTKFTIRLSYTPIKRYTI